MKKIIVTCFLLILIFTGIAMSIANLRQNVYAMAAIWGTATVETSLFWQLVYYLQGRWLYDNVYCIGNPSDCVIEP